MSHGKNMKRYGPQEWPESVLAKAYNCPTENNDEPVTREIVEGWLTYFREHTEGFRDSHKAIIARVEGTD